MDRVSKILIGAVISGVITLAVGSSYIPSSGGAVPPNMSAQEFSEQQQKDIHSSIGFKVTMVGTGITIASILMLYLRSCMEDYRVEDRPSKSQVLRSILKVKRIHPEKVKPEQVQHEQRPIEIIVEDPKPQVRTTPSLIAMVPAPSSSPPPQLIPYSIFPRGPVIEKIPLPTELRRTFKYPPPYDGMNR